MTAIRILYQQNTPGEMWQSSLWTTCIASFAGIAPYHDGKQIALHRISYQKKDMVVNAHHYRRLTVKQSFDIENTLLDGDNVIDFPIKPHDLSRYDEVLP